MPSFGEKDMLRIEWKKFSLVEQTAILGFIYIIYIWYMMYDVWYMIYDTWYMIYDTWYMIYDISFIIYIIYHIYHISYIYSVPGSDRERIKRHRNLFTIRGFRMVLDLQEWILITEENF